MPEMNDAELLKALGVEAKPEKKKQLSPREERIIAGFEDIQRFVEEHGRLPAHGEDKDIFERLYATRLEQIRKQPECLELLESLDHQGLLGDVDEANLHTEENLDDEDILGKLGVSPTSDSDVRVLKHVKSRAEIRAAEEIASRTPCKDFEAYKPMFIKVQEELDEGTRVTARFQRNAEIKQGEFFILGGQKVYVDQVGEEFINEYDRKDSRLRVIYDNGTESNILLRSLQRALYKDSAGRRVSDNKLGGLFSDTHEDTDLESGTIYVLRSKSQHPLVSENRDVIHKIGVTGGSVEKRIANAKVDATFLLADVEVVATYSLSNINRVKLEKIFHRLFGPAQLNIQLKDRFGNTVSPKEWFLVPLFVIDEAVNRIKDGSISDYVYDAESASLKKAS